LVEIVRAVVILQPEKRRQVVLVRRDLGRVANGEAGRELDRAVEIEIDRTAHEIGVRDLRDANVVDRGDEEIDGHREAGRRPDRGRIDGDRRGLVENQRQHRTLPIKAR